MTTPDAEAVASCEHAVIQTWRTEDGVVRLWACADCRLRFHPATIARRSEREALVDRVARLIDDHGWDYGDDEERESLRVKARAAIEGRP